MSRDDDKQRRPWDKLPEGETGKAFKAFEHYLGLGPDRSLLAAYRLYSGKEAAENTPGHFGAWSSDNRWVERAEAYDRFEIEREIDARQLARERARQLYVDALPELARKEIAIALGTDQAPMTQIVALKNSLARAGVDAPKQVEVSGRDGKPIQTETTSSITERDRTAGDVLAASGLLDDLRAQLRARLEGGADTDDEDGDS